MHLKKISLNIKELQKWYTENCKKKQFKKYNFLNLKSLIQALKIKRNFKKGKLTKGINELFKKPFNIKNFKYLALLFLPKIK